MTDERILEEVAVCNTCFEWHHNCNAECCRQFNLILPKNFNTSKLKPGVELTLKVLLTVDKRRYYKLHNVILGHDFIKVKLDRYKVQGNVITIYGDCNALTSDLRCQWHGTRWQPQICHKPNLHENKDLKGVTVTENCLYRWK